VRTLLIVLALAACSPEASQSIHPRPAAAPSASAALALQDRDFLERATKGGNAEVAAGALAESRAMRGEVKAFGRKMVAHHSAANERLAAFAAARRIALPDSLGEQQHGFDRLVGRRGDSFDREFARVMVEDHQTALELYRSAASGVSDPALRALAAATRPMIAAHLEEAEGLRASLREGVQ
jgi:putative membrane protein